MAIEVFRKYGVRGVYRGGIPNFFREVMGGAYYFGVYETLKNWKYPVKPDGSRDKMSFGYIMLYGGLAGVGFWAPGYPWDVIKTKM